MINYTIDKFLKDYDILLKKIKISKKYKNNYYNGIYPVLKSGIPLSIFLYKDLNLPIVTKFNTINELKHLLVVDSIIVSGITRQLFIHSDFICLHIRNSKLKKIIYPTYYVDIIDDKWVHYWWDKNDK